MRTHLFSTGRESQSQQIYSQLISPFYNSYFQQIFGTPMGSPLSLIIADMVLQDLENKAVATFPFAFPFNFRFVDDIMLAISSFIFNFVLNTFNSFDPRL